jgi:eukaryotic-like serine/threonine-protein kinase
MLRVGDKVGDYEVLERIKAGGMGALYLAQRTGAAGFARPVAIKVMQADLLEDDESVRMFVEEALLSARIRHPNVVHVEQFGETEDGYYLVMEYVHGLSLSQLLSRIGANERAVSVNFAVYLALQVADGLHAAHELKDDDGEELGVVHRDVSPSNILLSADGYVKLIDFGIAKARSRSPTLHRTLKGKLRYMPPEQAFGKPVDRRADVYALGIVLWELLTMRRLFQSNDDFDLLEQVRKPAIAPPSTIRSELSADLDRVAMRALAPEPADRYESAHAFRDALAEACPSALWLTPHHVAALVRAFMDKTKEALPRPRLGPIASSPRVEAEPPPVIEISEEKAISTLTVEPIGRVESTPPPAKKKKSFVGLAIGLAIGALAIAGAVAVALGSFDDADPIAPAPPPAAVVEPREPRTVELPAPEPPAPPLEAPPAPHEEGEPTRPERRVRMTRERVEAEPRGPRLEQAGESVLIVNDSPM